MNREIGRGRPYTHSGPSSCLERDYTGKKKKRRQERSRTYQVEQGLPEGGILDRRAGGGDEPSVGRAKTGQEWPSCRRTIERLKDTRKNGEGNNSSISWEPESDTVEKGKKRGEAWKAPKGVKKERCQNAKEKLAGQAGRRG